MKSLVITAILTITYSSLFAQVVSNRDQKTRSQNISESRIRMMDFVIANDMIGLQEEYHRLITLEDENYISLYPYEKVLYNYWVRKFEDVLSMSTMPDSVFSNSSSSDKVHPQWDQLDVKLYEKVKGELSEIKADIRDSNHAKADVEFLQIRLDMNFMHEKDVKLSKRVMSDRGEEYLAAYPETSYKSYLTRSVIYKVNPENTSLDFMFSGNYGFFSGRISEQFNEFGSLGIHFDLYKGHWAYMLNMHIGGGSIQRSMIIDGDVWNKNDGFSLIDGDLGVGYVLGSYDRISFTPYASFGFIGIDNGEDNDEEGEVEVDLGTSFTYCAGIKIDFTAGTTWMPIAFRGDEIAYRKLQLRYEYKRLDFSNGFEGAMHNLTFAFGFFSNKKN